MTTARRMIAFVLPATLLAALSGCALIEPAVTEEPPTALETCALGALWTLDLTTLQEQVTTVLTEEGVPVTAVDAQGTQTLDWTAKSDMTITTDYTLTVTAQPSPEQIIVITEIHGGSSSGKAYINGDVAIPRKWSGGDFAVEATATSNGEALETVPYTMPRLVVDDSVGLELTCADSTMTVHPRGSDITLTYSRG